MWKKEQHSKGNSNLTLKSSGSHEAPLLQATCLCAPWSTYTFSLWIISCAVCTGTSFPLQQKAPDPGGLDEQPFQLCSYGEVNILLFETGTTVKQYRTDLPTPLNEIPNLLLSESPNVVSINSFTGWTNSTSNRCWEVAGLHRWPYQCLAVQWNMTVLSMYYSVISLTELLSSPSMGYQKSFISSIFPML